jgi:hypothetical protein
VKELSLWARTARVKASVLQMMGLEEEAWEWYGRCADAAQRLVRQAPASVPLGCHFTLLHEVHQLLADHFYHAGDFARFLFHLERCIAFTDDLHVCTA